MKLLKTIVTEYKVVWFKRDMMVYSERYIKARRNQSPLDHCFDCGRKFLIGEKINCVNFKGHTNKVFCKECLNKLAEGVPETQMFYHINNPTGEAIK